MATVDRKGVLPQKERKGRQAGKAAALTTLSPVLPEKHCALRRRLWLVGHVPALGRPLAALSFIYYARWLVIDALPDARGGGGRTKLNSKYLLFEGNYDGRPDDYLDAFSAAVPHRLARLWGTCVDFQQSVEGGPDAPRDRVIIPWRFRKYVRRNELEILHFYAAYPDATMVSVRQAIAIAGRDKHSPDGGRSPVTSARERRIVPLVLGPAREHRSLLHRLRRLADAQLRALTRRYGVYPLTVILPILREQRESLIKYLRGLPEEHGFMGRVEGTHFARFVLIDRHLTDLGQASPDSLPCSYLLFTSNHSGRAARYCRALYEGTEEHADQIWRACAGFSDVKDVATFRRWIKRHSYKTQYFFAAYPPRAVPQVRTNLELRKAWADRLGVPRGD
jgi:hypothetical protein